MTRQSALINNVIDVLPNNVPYLSSTSETSKLLQVLSETNEDGIEKVPQVLLEEVPSKSSFHDKEVMNEQLTSVNKSPPLSPSIPLKAVPALGAIPKAMQCLPSTSKSPQENLKDGLYSISSSYSYLYYDPNQKTKSKLSPQEYSFKSVAVQDTSSSSIDTATSSMLPKTPEPFLIPSEMSTENSLVQLHNFLSQLKGERDYSMPEINTHTDIAAIDENVKLNEKLASRKFFSLNPVTINIKDEPPLNNNSTESLIAVYDFDTTDSDENENYN